MSTAFLCPVSVLCTYRPGEFKTANAGSTGCSELFLGNLSQPHLSVLTVSTFCSPCFISSDLSLYFCLPRLWMASSSWWPQMERSCTFQRQRQFTWAFLRWVSGSSFPTAVFTARVVGMASQFILYLHLGTENPLDYRGPHHSLPGLKQLLPFRSLTISQMLWEEFTYLCGFTKPYCDYHHPHYY